MNWRHGAKRTKALLEYLADAQRHQQEKNSEAIAQMAAVDERNAALASTIGKLESLLTDALSRDPYVDLDSLKETPRIPAFGKVKPNKRDYLPAPPSSLASLLPWKRIAYRDKYEAAEARYNIDRQTYDGALAEHQEQAERIRAETAAHNEDIERYKQDFDAGKRQAVEDYFTQVLEKSALPAGFPKQATLAYVAEADELRIDFALPAIDAIPETQTYSYDVIRGEASPALMPPKQRRLLYSSVLAQICLRCIHEIFTADRTKKIDHIVFEGNADGINPSSGQPGRFRLVALSLSRGQYEALNLECVEPRACLYGLGGRLSSKPDQLLALPRAAPEAGQDAAADDGVDLARLKRRINELEGAMHAKDLHITELKNLIDEQRDQNRELASELEEKRDDVARLERQNEAQRERLAELAPALRDEQERNAELNALIQSRQDAIDHMKYAVVAQESNSEATAVQPDEASADTEPVETIDEWSAEDDMAEAGIFAPIGSDVVYDSAGGAPIPPRPSEPETELLEVMAVFVRAQGRYVDSVSRGLPQQKIDRLVRAGRLERRPYQPHKQRATLAGNKWYGERSRRKDLRVPKPPRPSPIVDDEADKTTTLGELLRGEAATSATADIVQAAPARSGSHAVNLLHRPAGTPDDLLTDLKELVTIMGDYGSETSRLIEAMAQNNWACNHHTLEAIFRGDENVTFANNIIDKINDRAHETVEHPIIIEENDQWIIDEEFRDEIAHILKHPEYLTESR